MPSAAERGTEDWIGQHPKVAIGSSHHGRGTNAIDITSAFKTENVLECKAQITLRAPNILSWFRECGGNMK